MEFNLKANRQRAEAVPDAAAERVSEASQEEPILSYFDWEIPALSAPQFITFLARVRFAEGERSFRAPIDVARLATEGRTTDLERLHGILAMRHAGLDDRRSLLEALEWLFAISLEQTTPELDADERKQ